MTALSPSHQPSLRILTVTNLWPESGSFRGVFVREQVEALRRQGHQVDVEVVAQARGKVDYLLAAPRVRRRARAGRYDIVHVHYGLTALAARLVTGIPKILSLYGSDINSPRQRRITRLGAGSVARIYVSRRLAVTAEEPEATVIANGVDFELFTPTDRAEARATLGIDPDARVVLFGGHPDNQVKGYDVFADVLAELRERGVPAQELVLAAPGQDRPAVVPKFAAADVMLFTSRKGTEASPTVVKEAATMNLPVVTVDVGDAAETLAHASPSTVVKFPEPWGTDESRATLITRLADAVEPLLTSPTRSTGREALAWLDTANVTRRLVTVYRSLLGSSTH
ncbi:hypothetical protein GCM10009765_05110 [Fodinicola feengrottensis]|uniref:Glycosyltransferase subfamily 4-like N-terminal domain-containing protein n=1 Tax=Fodinicola feengrottensis TaxID=435914 RepID=A0ABP4RQG8_9ACTN